MVALEPGSSRRRSEASAAGGRRLVQQLQNGRRRRREAQARPGGAAGTATEAVRAPRALRVVAGAPRGCASHSPSDYRAPAVCAGSGAALSQSSAGFGAGDVAPRHLLLSPGAGNQQFIHSFIQPAKLIGGRAQGRRCAGAPAPPGAPSLGRRVTSEDNVLP